MSEKIPEEESETSEAEETEGAKEEPGSKDTEDSAEKETEEESKEEEASEEVKGESKEESKGAEEDEVQESEASNETEAEETDQSKAPENEPSETATHHSEPEGSDKGTKLEKAEGDSKGDDSASLKKESSQDKNKGEKKDDESSEHKTAEKQSQDSSVTKTKEKDLSKKGSGTVADRKSSKEISQGSPEKPSRSVAKAPQVKAEKEVLEEQRSTYLWEGPCSSSSSSTHPSERKKGKKGKRGEKQQEEEEYEEDEEEEEEEEESSSSFADEEVKKSLFPREEYIQKYKDLLVERTILKKKNIILQKHVSDYCKKRKLEVYFEDVETPDPKLEAKYARQIKAFEEFLKYEEQKRISLREDLDKLQVDKNEAEVKFEHALEELLETEREVGTGLISASTGKPLADKVLDKLLIKQRKAILDLYDMRLKYIKLRDNLAGREAALKKLETFGEGLHLLDYEQLRMENQSYSDKIEERDEELTRLRSSATSSIQILAHIREKANATAMNIDELYEDLEFIEMEANRVREHTGELKRIRDQLRAQHAKRRREAGLLVHQRLLDDFERRIEESQTLSVQIQNLKNNYFDQNKNLNRVKNQEMINKNIEFGHREHSANEYKMYTNVMQLVRRRVPFSEVLKESDTKPRESTEAVQEIKKGRLDFFKKQRMSKLLTYVRQNKRPSYKFKTDDEINIK